MDGGVWWQIERVSDLLRGPIFRARQGVGVYIAAVAGLAILLRCLNGKGVADLMGSVITILAGVAIAAPQWPTTLSLGIVVFAYLAKETVGLFRSGKRVP